MESGASLTSPATPFTLLGPLKAALAGCVYVYGKSNLVQTFEVI